MAGMKRRGVRASRIKLEAALANSDLPKKNQAALADAIADEEELEAAPKDLVSKLFRELPVDPHTVERAARVLGVEAATLYPGEEYPALHPENNPGDIPPPPASESIDSPAPARASRYWRYAATLAVLTVILVAGVMLLPARDAHGCTNSLASGDVRTPTDRLGVIVARFADDPNNEAQMLLARALAIDPRLKSRVEVFTSCTRLAISPEGNYRSAIAEQRRSAAAELAVVDAQLLLWGERRGDRLNVRFATRRQGEAPVRLVLNDKPLVATEADFTVPVDLALDQPISNAVKFAAIGMMRVDDPKRAELRDTVKQAFNSSIEWLRKAVASDRNFLHSLSPQSDPRLYALTGNQLCYRLRLLGDYDGDDSRYAQAEQVCGKVLAITSRSRSPQEWVALHLNLGSVIVRRHLYLDTREARIAALNRALDMFEAARPAIDRRASPDNYSIFHRNLAVVHMRLGAMMPGKPGVAHLETALALTDADLKSLDRDAQPTDYSGAIENRCHIKEILSERTGVTGLLEEAQGDCREATQVVSALDQPYAWGLAQNMLAVTYAVAAEQRGDPASLRNALTEFTRAQSVYTRRDYPVDWAQVESNRGELTCKLAVMTRDASLLPRALTHIEAAQSVFLDHDLDIYTDYTENLVGNVEACDRDHIAQCHCTS